MRSAHRHAYPPIRPSLFSLPGRTAPACEDTGDNANDYILARLERRIAAEPKRTSTGGASVAVLACAVLVIAGLIATLVVLAREAGTRPRVQAASLTQALEPRQPVAAETMLDGQRRSR